MSLSELKKRRKLRLCYVDGEKRLFSTAKAKFEKSISALGTIESVPIKTLEDANFAPCDLLVIAADHIPDESFGEWLVKLKTRIHLQAGVLVPTFCFASLQEKTLLQLLDLTIKENWYFDIVDPNHLDSLPLRVANLLRIHDHIHELRRYEAELAQLQLKVADLEKRVHDSRH